MTERRLPKDALEGTPPVKKHPEVEALGLSQEVIDTIIAEKVTLPEDPENPDVESVRLSYGNKRLTLRLKPATPFVDTYIENISTANEMKEEQETTLLYAAAKQLMNDFYERVGEPVMYVFTSFFPKMKAWAETTGDKIFHWVDAPEKIGRMYTFIASIPKLPPEDEDLE